MNRLRLELTLFLLAVQFLTRLPVPRDLTYSDDLMIRSVRYYPMVGAIVGAVAAVVFGVGAMLWSPLVASIASLTATLLLTGAFHEDGLADAADGLVGGVTRDKALIIMKDSRIGTYGSVALLSVLGLKITALAALPVSVAALALIFGHVISRWVAVQVIATTDYARETGTKFVAPTITGDGWRFATFTALVAVAVGGLVLGLGMVTGLLGLALCAVAFWRFFLRKIGGYTGDCLGAIQQLAEVGFYLGVLAWL